MASIKCKTRINSNTKGKYRVYFTCHPEDFDFCFFKVCNDILGTYDCAIYYTEDMSAEITDEDKMVDIYSNNLFVIPVTKKLLTTPNRAMDSDFPYAVKEKMHILPIMMESEIDTLYSLKDKFGELQYLKAYECDSTEISYTVKLKKYLESVFLGDELIKRIRAAFDAYIFLSYRKKDRYYANELMRLIHSNPECMNIAIWFDEFLTPGESFKESIEKILDDCKLFALLVTPQLLEKVVDGTGEIKENYVISTELPLARKNKKEKGIDIFAVEMETTDREALAAIEIDEYINSKDPTFRQRLLDAVSRITATSQKSSESNYLIGLAYMEGIDVEVDREKGMQLIVDAAESGCLEAIHKMVDICKNSGQADKDKASEWLHRAVLVQEEEFRSTRDNGLLQGLIEDIANLFDLQMHHKVHEAKDMFVRVVEFDSFMIENGLYQDPKDAQKIRAAYANLFRHRAKKIAMINGREYEHKDFEEWLMVYEKLCLRVPDFSKDELAFAYLHYIEVLEEENAFDVSFDIANKLLQLSLKEAIKFKVQLKEDYSSKLYFDVPKDVCTYTFWLEMSLSGYLHIAIAYSENQKRRLMSIKKMLELAEYLRGHLIAYSTCEKIAICYKLLGRTLEKLGKIDTSQKANEYAILVENCMHMRKKIIPVFDRELHEVIDALINESV